MKKILLLCVLFTTIPALAINMCSRDEDNKITLSFVMDPSINGTGNSYDAGNMVWYTKFSWGVISGDALCSSYGIDSSTGKVFSQGKTEEDLEGKDASITGVEKKYCWCKMTHPAVSLWTFRNPYSSASDCASNCAYYCGNYARNSSALRGGLFGSVAK